MGEEVRSHNMLLGEMVTMINTNLMINYFYDMNRIKIKFKFGYILLYYLIYIEKYYF